VDGVRRVYCGGGRSSRRWAAEGDHRSTDAVGIASDNSARAGGLREASPNLRRNTQIDSGTQKLYCISTEQMWALHDAMPGHLKVAGAAGRVRRATGR